MSRKSGIRQIWDMKMPMRDGVLLSGDVYIPEGGLDQGPYPTILYRTPYDNQLWLYVAQANYFARHGYVVIIQDVRGRHDSEGYFYPNFKEYDDGYDSIEWIAEQPWSTGKIGMMGGSYDGWVQWAAARKHPPHLTTLISSCPPGRWFEEVPYYNGMVSLFMFAWLNHVSGRVQQNNALIDWNRVRGHLPLRTLDREIGREMAWWQEWIDHSVMDEFWMSARLTPEEFSTIDLPVLHFTGYFDGDQPGALYFYEGMKNHSPAADQQFIYISAWGHNGHWVGIHELGGVDFTPECLIDPYRVQTRWFDHWLKGEDTGLLEEPRARYFFTGANEWGQGDAWPPKGNDVPLYLRSGGNANTLRGDGKLSTQPAAEDEPTDELVYDPAVLVERLSGVVPGADAYSSFDARRGEMRDEVLVYTSDVLQESFSVAGRPWLVMYASSDCPDTDWICSMTYIRRSGESIRLASGMMRARFRESREYETLMEPGQVYEFRIELTSIAHTFKPGERIRVSLSNTAFPNTDRNLSTGEPIADAVDMRTAHNFVHHSSEHDSHLLLPVPLNSRSPLEALGQEAVTLDV